MFNVSGRDAAGIIKSLADDLFTPATNVGVNISVIQESLVQATLAGIAPDVALNIPKIDPINLAMRGALMDLSKFSDFDTVTERFYNSAIVPFIYKDGCYALPETQNFNMLFYRKDIFEELGIEVPQTWDDFYKVMSIIQKNNFQVGIGTDATSETLFESLLFQNGLSYYNDQLTETTFDQPRALEAFKQWTGFYTNYSLPLTYDFYNRFRSGEMPMALAPYTEYNRLSVAAPELNGLWDFAPIPGTVREDGTLDRSQSSNGTACIILKDTDYPEEAWEFIKWWTSDEVQELFGREIEALVGPAARYDTANKNAFEKLPWTKAQADSLKEQWKHVKNNYQIPGNYYISRNLLNAFRSVVYDFNNPRVVLNKYNIEMNKEIKRKRIEFD